MQARMHPAFWQIWDRVIKQGGAQETTSSGCIELLCAFYVSVLHLSIIDSVLES
jgi:hypothetical protein